MTMVNSTINLNRGFTLFEMVIAVAIFMVMGAIAYPSLTQVVKTGQAMNEFNQSLSELQFAVTYFSRDWVQLSSRKIRNRYGDEEHQVVINDNSIAFTRDGYSNLTQQSRAQLQRVRYRLVDKKLIREHWLSLDQGITEEPYMRVLLNEVEAFEVHLMDADGQAINTWPASGGSDTENPIALKLMIDSPHIGQIHRILEVPGEL